jgi:Na+/pantothenate symporter
MVAGPGAGDIQELIRLRFVAVVGLVALNALDLLLTRELLARGAVEANPLMALVIGGFWGVAIKLGVPILAGACELAAPVARRHVMALCWVNVLYLGVVAWNFHHLAGRYS